MQGSCGIGRTPPGDPAADWTAPEPPPAGVSTHFGQCDVSTKRRGLPLQLCLIWMVSMTSAMNDGNSTKEFLSTDRYVIHPSCMVLSTQDAINTAAEYTQPDLREWSAHHVGDAQCDSSQTLSFTGSAHLPLRLQCQLLHGNS